MSSTVMSTLKLSASRKPKSTPDIVLRRNKLILKLSEQKEALLAKQQGCHFASTRLRTFTNRVTGEKVTREAPIRIKPWFWVDESGKVQVRVIYGNRVLELAKGKHAVEVGTEERLLETFDALIKAVQNGEMDEQLLMASQYIRSIFKS